MTKLGLLDCQDSFTWNIVELFRRHGASVGVHDAREPMTVPRDSTLDGWILSPGPGRPSHWPGLFDFLDRLDPRIPVLGICLGHQAIGQFYGARLRRESPLHGEAVLIHREGGKLLEGLQPTFSAMRYNSLGLDPYYKPMSLRWTAWGPAGELMALEHAILPRYGLQFHPDSILTPDGPAIALSFLEIVKGNRAGNGPPLSLDSQASCAHSSVG